MNPILLVEFGFMNFNMLFISPLHLQLLLRNCLQLTDGAPNVFASMADSKLECVNIVPVQRCFIHQTEQYMHIVHSICANNLCKFIKYDTLKEILFVYPVTHSSALQRTFTTRCAPPLLETLPHECSPNVGV